MFFFLVHIKIYKKFAFDFLYFFYRKFNEVNFNFFLLKIKLLFFLLDLLSNLISLEMLTSMNIIPWVHNCSNDPRIIACVKLFRFKAFDSARKKKNFTCETHKEKSTKEIIMMKINQKRGNKKNVGEEFQRGAA